MVPLVRRLPLWYACCPLFLNSLARANGDSALNRTVWTDMGRNGESDSDDRTGSLPPKARTERPTDAKWMRCRGDGFSWAERLCDACGRKALDRNTDGDLWDTHAVVAIGLGRPHVWSLCQADGCIRDLIYADHIEDMDFVVPAAAAHMLDPQVLGRLARWVVDEPTVDLWDLCFCDVGSIRGWMPLRGSHVVRIAQISWYREYKRTRVAMVCCDRRNPLWGAVMIIDFGRTRFSMAWHGIDDDIGSLLRRWKRHPLRTQEPRFARNWVEWAGEVYIDTVERSLDIGYRAKDKEGWEYLDVDLADYTNDTPLGPP